MGEYDYFKLKELRDGYSLVRNHDEERKIANALMAYLDEPDKQVFASDFKVYNYGGEPPELLPLHPRIDNRVAYLDGLLQKLDKPTALYTDEELRGRYFDLYKSKQIEIVGKQVKSITTDNLSFVANELDIRHAQSEGYMKAIQVVIPDDVQRTVIFEGIKIMENDDYLADNIVFNAVCAEVRTLFKANKLSEKKRSD